MYYAPHILQVKVTKPMETDEFGRPIPGTGGESWQDVCKCRCDDNATKEFKSENGSVYRPNFHVVCGKRISLKAGDEVRAIWDRGLKAITADVGDGTLTISSIYKDVEVRGEGEVYTVKNTNYFNNSELWM